MGDTRPTDATATGASGDPHDAKVREEWSRLERERIEEEIAEAREDVATQAQEHPPRRQPAWLAFAVAIAAGIAVAAIVNALIGQRR